MHFPLFISVFLILIPNQWFCNINLAAVKALAFIVLFFKVLK